MKHTLIVCRVSSALATPLCKGARGREEEMRANSGVTTTWCTVHWDEHNFAFKKAPSNQLKHLKKINFGLILHTYLVLKPENMSKFKVNF